MQRRSGEKTSHIETIITKGIKFLPLQAGSRIGLELSHNFSLFTSFFVIIMAIISTETYNLKTEIRKLKPAEMNSVSQILNNSNSWKKLMAIIPKEGSENEYKFSWVHFK